MNETKKVRRKLTDADRLAELGEAWKRARAKAEEAERKYMDALNAAHKRAQEAAASLPPLPKAVPE